MQRRTSEAKAHNDYMRFMPGMNPRLTLKRVFSASYEAEPFVQGNATVRWARFSLPLQEPTGDKHLLTSPDFLDGNGYGLAN